MSKDNMYNPYAGFSAQNVPGYNQPYDRCNCGLPDACGIAHQPAVKVRVVAKATGGGKVDIQETVIEPQGNLYRNNANAPFGTWDGHLVASDFNPPRVKPYRPPALPYVCDRPVAGSSLCGVPSKCNP